MTWELRRAGIPTELYLGTAKGPGKQLKYADQYDIPLALLYGSNEKEQGDRHAQGHGGRARQARRGDRRPAGVARRSAPGSATVPRGELVATIRAMLDQIEAQRR